MLLGRDAERLAAPLRPLRRVFERTGEAARLARGDVPRIRRGERHGKAGRNADDDDDDQHLDQREPRVPGARTCALR